MQNRDTTHGVPSAQNSITERTLRVLIVEDSPADAELAKVELANAGYEVSAQLAATAAEFSDALVTGEWDVVIADYTLPSFGALAALNVLKQSRRDIPFIIVSGAITDETAVAAMRAGAHDYVLKDNIARLVPAVEREITEAANRGQRRRADAALRLLSAIIESSDDAIIGKTLDGTITTWNAGAERLYGYSAAEIIGRSIAVLLPPGHPNELQSILPVLAKGERIEQYETVRQRKDGTLVEVLVKISPIFDVTGQVIGASSIARDITARKREQQELEYTRQRADQSSAQLRTVIDSMAERVFVCDAEGRPLVANEAFRALYPGALPVFPRGFAEAIEAFDLDGKPVPVKDWPIGRALNGEQVRNLELRVRSKRTGEESITSYNADPVLDSNGRVIMAVMTASDVTAHRRAEQALRQSERRLRRFYESEMLGVFYWNANGAVMDANQKFLDMVGYSLEELAAGQVSWSAMTPPEDRGLDEVYLAQAKMTGIHPPREKQYVRKDGTRITVLVGAATTDDARTEGVAWALDITERKQAEEAFRQAQEALAHSEQRYRSFVEASSQVIWRTDPVGQVDAEIPAWNQYTGQSHEEAQGWGWMQAIVPEDRERVSAAWLKASQSRTLYDVEYCLRRHDGALRQVHARGVPILEQDGRIREWIGTCIDVTEQKRAEAALRASEEKFRAAFQGAAVGIGRVSFADSRWMDANEALCRMVGYTEEEMRATPWPQITHPEDVDIDFAPFQRMAAGELESYAVEKRFIHKKGHIVWARLSLSMARDAHGKPDYEIAVVEDITERKRAEKELEHSRNELKFALEAAGAGAWSWQVGADHFDLDLKSQNLLYMPEHATLRDAFERIATEDQAQIENELRACANGLREYAVEFRVRSPQGIMRWIEARGRLLEVEGTPWIYGINHDITQRKAAEDALRESEQRFRAVADNVPEMLWAVDSRGHFLYLSPKWVEYTGVMPQEGQEDSWADSVHPEDRPASVEAWRRAVATNGKYEVEYRLRRRDGTYRWHSARAVLLKSSSSDSGYFFGTTTDIHDQKRAQEALIRSEKLASVGRMAATVAHEINNPLASALNAIFLASMDSSASSSVHKRLQVAEAELERVAHMTRQTLGFYRETGKPTAVNLCDVVDGTLMLYQPKLKAKSITVRRRFSSRAIAHGIEGELRQIVSNLVANSIDAVNGNSVLHVRTSEPIDMGSRKMVRLTIADNGGGISRENLKRIFEPFFTTKQSIGTGLGLWVTKQLVEKDHGCIRVRSRVGRGTVFSIWLPADRRSAVREQERLTLDSAQQRNCDQLIRGEKRSA